MAKEKEKENIVLKPDIIEFYVSCANQNRNPYKLCCYIARNIWHLCLINVYTDTRKVYRMTFVRNSYQRSNTNTCSHTPIHEQVARCKKRRYHHLSKVVVGCSVLRSAVFLASVWGAHEATKMTCCFFYFFCLFSSAKEKLRNGTVANASGESRAHTKHKSAESHQSHMNNVIQTYRHNQTINIVIYKEKKFTRIFCSGGETTQLH